MPGGHSEWEPPDPIPNSEVKTLCADGSVPFRHARVGHRQASNRKPLRSKGLRGFFFRAPGEKCCVRVLGKGLRMDFDTFAASMKKEGFDQVVKR